MDGGYRPPPENFAMPCVPACWICRRFKLSSCDKGNNIEGDSMEALPPILGDSGD